MSFNLDPNTINTVFKNLPPSTQEYLVNPAAKSVGETVGALCDIVFLLPKLGGIWADGILEKYKQKIQQKVRRISDDDRDKSKLSLVMKALEESRYQLNEEELQICFANLIASTVNKKKNTQITPRYAIVLSQIGLGEAVLLRKLAVQRSNTLLNISGFLRSGNIIHISHKILYLSEDNEVLDNIESEVSILESLGILKELEYEISVDTLSSVVFQKISKKVKVQLQDEKISNLDLKNSLISRNIEITPFGRNFIDSVVDVNVELGN